MRAYRAFMAVLAAGVLAAACGAQGVPRAPATARSAATAAAGLTAAGNEKLARQEAQHLLALVPVPGGAVPLASVPRSVPAPSRPEVTSLVDQARAWRLAMPQARAATWLHAHPPPGLPLNLTSSGTDTGGILAAEYGYAGPDSPAWASAQLKIEVVAAPGGTSVLRADGEVSWLDPVPLRDTSIGPRTRLTVAGRCPRSDVPPGLPARAAFPHGVVNPAAADPGGDLKRRLLPAGAPTAGLECRYYGLNGPEFRLRSATRLDAAQARRLAAAMTALPLSHAIGGVSNCGFDDETADVVALSYPGRADVDLWVKVNGCPFVSNGDIRTAGN